MSPKFRVRNVSCLPIHYAQALALLVRTWGFRQMFPSVITVPVYHFWGVWVRVKNRRIVIKESDVHSSILQIHWHIWCCSAQHYLSLLDYLFCLPAWAITTFSFYICLAFGIWPSLCCRQCHVSLSVGVGLWLQRIGCIWKCHSKLLQSLYVFEEG